MNTTICYSFTFELFELFRATLSWAHSHKDWVVRVKSLLLSGQLVAACCDCQEMRPQISAKCHPGCEDTARILPGPPAFVCCGKI